MSHEAHVVHLRTGWIRWAVRCPECELYQMVWNRDAAEELVVEHAGDTTEAEPEHSCYDVASMEWAPVDSCAACKAGAA